MVYGSPPPMGVTHHAPEKAYAGYTLFTPLGGDGSVFLVDMRGEVVHRWQMPFPGNLAQLLPDGHLMFDGKLPDGPVKIGGATGVVVEADWDGKVLWEYRDPYLHHDHCRMANGHTMVLGWEELPAELSRRVQGGLPGTEDRGRMWGDFFREVNSKGEAAWEWHAHEHLDPAEQRICPLCYRREWTHANTVEVLPDGDVLTSFRLTDTIGIIDKKTGDWRWKWGRGVLSHQHDPTMLENGNVLVFDNGTHTPEKPRSRVLEVSPKTGEIIWEYSDPRYLGFFSASISGCQRLPNGNTLVCEGNRGRVFEVTPQCEVAWEYFSPFFYTKGVGGQRAPTNWLFRAYRYGPDFTGLRDKELDARKYAWLNRAYLGL